MNHEAPIDVRPGENPTNEPAPDILVLRRRMDAFRTGNIPPEELILVVEVADSTLSSDLRVKASLYARAGVPEYWVADVPNRRIIVHREPADGRYQSVIAYFDHESVAPQAAPEAMFEVRLAFFPQTPEI